MEHNQEMKDYYANLSLRDKLHSILGFTRQPVSRELTLDLGGIKYDQLNESEKRQVDAVFKEEDVITTIVEGTQRYRLDEKSRIKRSSKFHNGKRAMVKLRRHFRSAR